jgi:hypothetical protein
VKAELKPASMKAWAMLKKLQALAEAASGTAKRLARIAEHIAHSFRTLIAKFSVLDGVSVTDRRVFIMGLYDGMMNELRDAGQPLPSRPGLKKRARAKKRALSPATGLHIHPYTLALALGRQIRISVPLEEITAELARATQQSLTKDAGARDHQGTGGKGERARLPRPSGSEPPAR